MQIFYIKDTKGFMSFLFNKNSPFIDYEVRGVTLNTVTRFEISCVVENDGEPVDEKPKYCKWGSIMPYVLSLIKGGSAPSYLKIIFCVSGDNAVKIHDNAKALFASVKYEKGGASLVTGTAQIQFSLDKEMDSCWDDYVLETLGGFEITVEEAQ